MITKYTFTKTPSGGNASWNTDDIRGISYMLHIKPTTESTTYNFTITDDQSLVVYSKSGLRGTFRDMSQFALKGIHTFAIASASANEEFKIQIIYNEIPS